MEEDPTLLNEGLLDMLRKEDHIICILCKKHGLSLQRCLRKMSEGYTSNGTTHLQEKHKDDMEILEQNKKRTLATLLTNPSNGFSNRSAKKAKVSSTSIN